MRETAFTSWLTSRVGQVNAGDVRLMMSCCEAAMPDQRAALGQTAASFVDRFTMFPTATLSSADDFGGVDKATVPTFLVLVLDGFSASSQAQEPKPAPRLQRSSTLQRSGMRYVHAGEQGVGGNTCGPSYASI